VRNKPPFLLVLGAVLGKAYFGYLFYQVWFDSDRLYQQSKKAMRRLPSWHPLKSYYLWRLGEKKSWVNERKVMSIVVLLFLLLFDSLIIVAAISGN
jgi:hypothetical protein